MKQDLEKDQTVIPKGNANSSSEEGESLSPPDLMSSMPTVKMLSPTRQDGPGGNNVGATLTPSKVKTKEL